MRKLIGFSLAVLFAGALAACEQGPIGPEDTSLQSQADAQTSSSATTVTDRYTLTGQIPREGCTEEGNPEAINGTFTLRGLVHQTNTSSGRVTFVLQLQVKARGVGAETGTVYEGMENWSLSRTFDANGAPFTLNFTRNMQLISHGPTPNRLLRGRIHLTINAQGKVTSSRTEFVNVCR